MISSTTTLLVTLVGLAAALPAPAPITMLGAPFSVDQAVSPAPQGRLMKRQACTTSRACGRIANGRTSCTQGQCVYYCIDGYSFNPVLKTCAPIRNPKFSRSVQPQATSAAPTPVATTTAAPVPTVVALTFDEQSALDEHNRFRALHGAGPLKWDLTLATFAKEKSSACVFQHSGGPYGENLAASAGGSPSVVAQIGMWEAEAKDYNTASPQYSHFTAMVWKSTTELGCAFVSCPAGSIFPAQYGGSKMLWCNYKSVVPNSGGPDNYRLNVQP